MGRGQAGPSGSEKGPYKGIISFFFYKGGDDPSMTRLVSSQMLGGTMMSWLM